MSDHPDRCPTHPPRSEAAAPELRTATIRTPDDVIRAVPYLLGFRPSESLVLLALAGPRLVLTVRLDLADATSPDPRALRETLAAMARAQADRLLGVVVTDTPLPDAAVPGTATVSGATATQPPGQHSPSRPQLPYADMVAQVGAVAAGFALELTDAMLLQADRWWSYQCDDPACCPSAGRPVDMATSSFETLAVTYGTVPLDSREELARSLEPFATSIETEELHRAAAALRRRITAEARTGQPDSWQQPLIDKILADARRPDDAFTPASAARWAVALRLIPIRDAVWAAIDSGRVPDPQRWRTLGRLLPAPYCAAPLFLFGWSAWRSGNGALANVCVERVLAADPGYSAIRLLDLAVRTGLNPRTTPRLDLSS